MLLLAWLVAVLIRLATGSATVATVTASGILAPLAAACQHRRDLADGARHRRRVAVLLPRQRRRLLAGQGVLRAKVGQTIKTWSLMETILSVSGLVFVLLLNLVV